MTIQTQFLIVLQNASTNPTGFDGFSSGISHYLIVFTSKKGKPFLSSNKCVRKENDPIFIVELSMSLFIVSHFREHVWMIDSIYL
jgi:hypothetical protein